MYYQIIRNGSTYYKGRNVEHAIAKGFRFHANKENPVYICTGRVPILKIYFDPDIGADVFSKITTVKEAYKKCEKSKMYWTSISGNREQASQCARKPYGTSYEHMTRT